MLEEISKLIKFISKDENGKRSRNLILFFLAFTILLLFINRYFISIIINQQFFLTRSALAKLMISNNISPYSNDISAILGNYYSSRTKNITIDNFIYRDPIYQLLILFPFSLIVNLDWSFAIWITINQILLFLILDQIYQLFDWKPDLKEKGIVFIIVSISYLSLTFFLDSNFQIIQLFLLLLGLNFYKKEKAVLSGIFLGLTTIDLFAILFPLVIITALIFKDKKKLILIWIAISIILLSLTGVIFDANWPLKMLRNLILEPDIFPFIGYGLALAGILGTPSISIVVNIIPLLIIIWIFVEWYRMPKDNPQQDFWLISLILCLNPILIVRNNFQPGIFLLFTYYFIYNLWNYRSEGKVKYVVFTLFLIIAIFLPLLGLIFPSKLGFFKSTISINLINIFYLVFILYWVRWWILQTSASYFINRD